MLAQSAMIAPSGEADVKPDDRATRLVHDWHHDGRITTFSWIGHDPCVVPNRAYALAFTHDDRILLVGADSRQWWLPGGGIEDGESAEQALRRELDEEAGAVIEDLEFLGYQRLDDPIEGCCYTATYWCRVALPGSFVPRHEVTKHLIVEPEQFLDNLFWSDDPAAAHLLKLATAVNRRR